MSLELCRWLNCCFVQNTIDASSAPPVFKLKKTLFVTGSDMKVSDQKHRGLSSAQRDCDTLLNSVASERSSKCICLWRERLHHAGSLHCLCVCICNFPAVLVLLFFSFLMFFSLSNVCFFVQVFVFQVLGVCCHESTFIISSISRCSLLLRSAPVPVSHL